MQIKYEQISCQPGTSFNAYVNEGPVYPFDMHCHGEYELVYFLSGRGKTYLMNTALEFAAGDCVLFGPNVPHTFVSQGNDNRAAVAQFVHDFMGDGFWDNCEFAAIKKMLTRSSRGLYFARAKLVGLASEFELIPRGHSVDRLLRLLGCLDGLSQVECDEFPGYGLRSGLPNQTQALVKVLNYIHANLADDLSTSRLAALVDMSESGFIKFFKRGTGIPVNDYVIESRVESACQRLVGSSAKVIDVAFDVGFNNLSNFNRQFKHRRKMTPKQYRREFSD